MCIHARPRLRSPPNHQERNTPLNISIRKRLPGIYLLLWALVFCAIPLAAQEVKPAPTIDDLQKAIAALQKQTDIVWTLVAGALVFFMQAGFAMVETGFTRAKNAGNIMMKNLLDFCMGGVAYWAVGFALMFGISNGLFGTSNFLLNFDNSTVDGQWGFTFWFFQIVFAATAATIVSGAMAERTKFSAYLVYSFLISLIIYPIFGHWAWGNLFIADNAKSGAWLANRGFIDFAGSTVVHSIGGWAALAGAWLWVRALASSRKTERRMRYLGIA